MCQSPCIFNRAKTKFTGQFHNFHIPLGVKFFEKSKKKLTRIGMCRWNITVYGLLVHFFSILRSHKCGVIYTRFHVLARKRRSSMDLSNNISERRCELKANEPVSGHSERVSGYIVGFETGWMVMWAKRTSQTVSGKSAIYYIIEVS